VRGKIVPLVHSGQPKIMKSDHSTTPAGCKMVKNKCCDKVVLGIHITYIIYIHKSLLSKVENSYVQILKTCLNAIAHSSFRTSTRNAPTQIQQALCIDFLSIK